jgi:hypothetical protein
MNALTIILLIYVILDIVASLVIYAVLRLNGWSRYELARRFRDLLREPADDFLEGIADERDEFDHYEDGIEVR